MLLAFQWVSSLLNNKIAFAVFQRAANSYT